MGKPAHQPFPSFGNLASSGNFPAVQGFGNSRIGLVLNNPHKHGNGNFSGEPADGFQDFRLEFLAFQVSQCLVHSGTKKILDNQCVCTIFRYSDNRKSLKPGVVFSFLNSAPPHKCIDMKDVHSISQCVDCGKVHYEVNK